MVKYNRRHQYTATKMKKQEDWRGEAITRSAYKTTASKVITTGRAGVHISQLKSPPKERADLPRVQKKKENGGFYGGR